MAAARLPAPAAPIPPARELAHRRPCDQPFERTTRSLARRLQAGRGNARGHLGGTAWRVGPESPRGCTAQPPATTTPVRSATVVQHGQHVPYQGGDAAIRAGSGVGLALNRSFGRRAWRASPNGPRGSPFHGLDGVEDTRTRHDAPSPGQSAPRPRRWLGTDACARVRATGPQQRRRRENLPLSSPEPPTLALIQAAARRASRRGRTWWLTDGAYVCRPPPLASVAMAETNFSVPAVSHPRTCPKGAGRIPARADNRITLRDQRRSVT